MICSRRYRPVAYRADVLFVLVFKQCVSALIFLLLNLSLFKLLPLPPLPELMRERNFCTVAKTRVDNEYDNEFSSKALLMGFL